MTTKDMIRCSIFTVLIALGAFIKVPIPVVPFTLQFLFTLLAGLLLGSRLGAISVALYAALGLIGLPIFAEGGGLWYILKPSFGYIPGFILGTYITGRLTENLEEYSSPKILLANFLGLFAVYGCGMIYYYVVSNYIIHTPIGLWPLFLYCFILAVPGDICLCILGTVLAKKLQPVLNKSKESRVLA